MKATSEARFRKPSLRLALPVAAMAVVIAVSNYLVQFPIGAYLTWAAFTYPFAFVVTDISNRWAGPKLARRVAWAGFALGVFLSIVTATPRIAAASGTAFIAAQLLDIRIFNQLRNRVWWRAPLVGSVIGSMVDTALFFSLAFAGTDVPWLPLAVGDLGVKLGMAVLLLLPYRWASRRLPPAAAAAD